MAVFGDLSSRAVERDSFGLDSSVSLVLAGRFPRRTLDGPLPSFRVEEDATLVVDAEGGVAEPDSLLEFRD